MVWLWVHGGFSRRDCLAVWEHTLGSSASNRREIIKSDYASEAHALLLTYMNDNEDRKALRDWWAGPVDPSNCTLSGPTTAGNSAHQKCLKKEWQEMQNEMKKVVGKQDNPFD